MTKNVPVFSVENSGNGKLGPMSATYVSQDSCSPDCPHKDNGCFTESGVMAIHTGRLNRATAGESPEELALLEALAIDGLSGRMDLRVHVVGDCRTPTAATIVAAAMKRHRKKRDRAAWTYTHSWRDIPVKSWLGESVLASVETARAAKQAMRAGYPAALVVVDFEGHTKAYRKDGVKLLPCKEQVDGTQCIDCLWCSQGEALLRTGTVIGFLAHGTKRKNVVETIQRLTIRAKVLRV